MKKILAAFAMSSLSATVSAMPANTKALVQDLISSGKLAPLLEEAAPFFQSLNIEQVNKYASDALYQQLLEACGSAVASRSASILKVTFDAKTYYFATPSEPQDLQLCK